MAEQIACLTAAGIPVMAHIGFTPQSVNTLGGFRVQGRGDAAEQTIADAIAVAEAGAFAVVMEMVPAELATQITGKLTIPTVGIGAGPNCDGQVLVWQDMAGFSGAKTARFVKRYADVGGELRRAAMQYAQEVAGGVFPLTNTVSDQAESARCAGIAVAPWMPSTPDCRRGRASGTHRRRVRRLSPG